MKEESIGAVIAVKPASLNKKEEKECNPIISNVMEILQEELFSNSMNRNRACMYVCMWH